MSAATHDFAETWHYSGDDLLEAFLALETPRVSRPSSSTGRSS